MNYLWYSVMMLRPKKMQMMRKIEVKDMFFSEFPYLNMLPALEKEDSGSSGISPRRAKAAFDAGILFFLLL
jgi:hypothetical protein